MDYRVFLRGFGDSDCCDAPIIRVCDELGYDEDLCEHCGQDQAQWWRRR